MPYAPSFATRSCDRALSRAEPELPASAAVNRKVERLIYEELQRQEQSALDYLSRGRGTCGATHGERRYPSQPFLQ